MESYAFSLNIDGVALQLFCLRRKGEGTPLVCLHGFGSTKEDYCDLALRPDFDGRDLVLLDTPGCGQSEISDPDTLSIPFLVKVVLAVCDQLGLRRFHLLGHSMGGLTGLMLAHQHRNRVLGFINIEGNVAPEDCFLSRQIMDHPADTPEAFLDGFVERVKMRQEYSIALYAHALRSKVRPSTVAPIFSSMVDLSDNMPLFGIFADLGCPRVFIYGEQNRQLSYLGDLPAIGVDVVEIPHSGHFPMYSNPPVLWAAIAEFLARHEDSA